MSNRLVLSQILLSGEEEEDLDGSLESSERGSGCVALAPGGDDGDVLQSEWVVVAGRVGILSGAKEIVETNNDHVANGSGEGSTGVGAGMANQLKGDWFHLFGWGILKPAGSELQIEGEVS